MAPAVGPAVAPAVEVVGPAVEVVAVVPAPVVAAVLGCVDGAVSAGFPNNPPAAGAGCAVGAEVAVAAVPGVVVAVDLGPPNRFKPDEAAAGVDEGAAEEAAPPREGKAGCCVVAVDVAGVVEGWVVVVEPSEKAGFEAESAPEAGVLKSEDVCPCVPPADGAAVDPKSDFDSPPVVAAGVVDSVGLSLFKFENMPPPLGAGAVPNVGVVCCCADPKRPPDDGCCVAPPNKDELPEAGAAVDGVVDELVAFKPAKSPPGF